MDSKEPSSASDSRFAGRAGSADSVYDPLKGDPSGVDDVSTPEERNASEERNAPAFPFLTFDPSLKELTSSGGRHRRREVDVLRPEDEVSFMGHPLTGGGQRPWQDESVPSGAGYPGFPSSPADASGYGGEILEGEVVGSDEAAGDAPGREDNTPDGQDLYTHPSEDTFERPGVGGADARPDDLVSGGVDSDDVSVADVTGPQSSAVKTKPAAAKTINPSTAKAKFSAAKTKQAESGKKPTGRRYPHAKFWSTVAGSVASLMMTLDMTIVLVALPDIGESLKLSLSGSQWIVNAYTLAFAALLLGVGSLSDLVGRRGIFIVGQLIFVAASVGCMTADAENWMIVARAIQGAGGAMVFGSSLPLLSDVFGPGEEKQRTSAVAVFMAAGAAAVALGPLVGGAIIEFFDWRWIFAINIPIGLLIIGGTLFGVPKDAQQWRQQALEERKAHLLAEGYAEEVEKLENREVEESVPPISWLTLIVASVFLFALNYALLTGPDDGWTDGKVFIGFGVSLAGLVILVWMQLAKGDKAMIDVRMFTIPSFSAVTIVAFAARLFSFGMMPYIILWLSGAVGLTSLEVGYVTTALAIPIILFSPVAIQLGKRIKVSAIQALGMIIIAAGLLLGLKLNSNSGWVDIIPMYIVVGIGTGLMLPHLMDVAVSVVAPRKTGTATGIANTAFPLGTSFGVAIYGAIITAATSSGLKAVSFPTASVMNTQAGAAQQMPPGASAPVPQLPPGAVLSPDKSTITMDAPQKIVDLASSGQFSIIRQHAPMFVDKALESYINGLHNVLIIAAVLAAVGALVALIFIRDKDRYEIRIQKEF